MKSVEQLANAAVDACIAVGADYMLTGALAFNYYAVPRSTRDVDLVIDVSDPEAIANIIARLSPAVEFGTQVQFDTITWGKRHIGKPVDHSAVSIELFELFDDNFVLSQFRRKRRYRSPTLGREVWLPTAEDVIVQKLRWARSKDLDDARDVIAVQQPENLDLPYIERWCREHGSLIRLEAILDALPDF